MEGASDSANLVFLSEDVLLPCFLRSTRSRSNSARIWYRLSILIRLWAYAPCSFLLYCSISYGVHWVHRAYWPLLLWSTLSSLGTLAIITMKYTELTGACWPLLMWGTLARVACIISFSWCFLEANWLFCVDFHYTISIFLMFELIYVVSLTWISALILPLCSIQLYP